MEYYSHQSTFSLEKYFIEIEDWLAKDIEKEEDNVPLVIDSEKGVGKKTLIANWINYHTENTKQKFPDIIIPHFASAGGNNSNYFFTIYRILIKLREIFNIKQKVELLEEKIRKNFSYWLNLCQTKMK